MKEAGSGASTEVESVRQSALFRFRVLLERRSEYGVFVARCLETGSVATSDTQRQAIEMIEELLCDEVVFAVEKNNFNNLFSSPAPFSEWKRFQEARGEREIINAAIRSGKYAGTDLTICVKKEPLLVGRTQSEARDLSKEADATANPAQNGAASNG